VEVISGTGNWRQSLNRCQGNGGERKENKHNPLAKGRTTRSSPSLLSSVVGAAPASMAVATSGVSWACGGGAYKKANALLNIHVLSVSCHSSPDPWHAAPLPIPY
jgi:hypothetical protein